MTAQLKTTRVAREGSPVRGRPAPLALTIACHPQPARIGERALLVELGAGQPVRLSRAAPEFAAPGSAWGRPLDDPFLSRTPVVLRAAGSGEVELARDGATAALLVDGEPLGDLRRITTEELARGVVLELAERVVLVLHEAPGPSLAKADDGELIGASAAAERVRAAIDRVADLEVPVLLRGESGTGKELVARALHRQSQRSAAPFLAVNLGAVPPSLAAAELFGSVRGAYTGAVSAQKGYFRAAEGGTLFLDEVGEAPPEVQGMLLRALESGEIVPVGSQQPQRVKVRLVAATDSDLEARVARGDFKAPLLHRLAAYEIWLPPLRERRDDLGRLFLHFARQELAALGEGHRIDGPDPGAQPWLPAPLMSRLLAYGWPGNVRELRNLVRQLVIDARGEPQLAPGTRLEALLAASRQRANRAGRGILESEAPGSAPSPRRPADVSSDEIERALAASRYDLAAAARQLGISRASLYLRVREHPRLRVAEDLGDEEIRLAIEEAGGDVHAAALSLRVSARALKRRLSPA